MKSVILFLTILFFSFGFNGAYGTILSSPATVPAPATMLLLGIGAFSLAAMVRRKLIR